MSDTSAGLLRVAVIGRVNGGKTTLVRTLLRRVVGEVDDRANVTRHPEPHADPELGVVLVDCPGFQDAGSYRAWRMMRSVDPAESERLRNGIDFSPDDAAMEVVAGCDIALFVASAETVPTAAHAQELRLLRDANPLVVAVLNKARLARRALGDTGGTGRVAEWERFFYVVDVPWMEYDAHASPPAALARLYELLEATLSGERAERLRTCAAARDERAAAQRRGVALAFAREVLAFRGTVITAAVPAREYTERRGEEVALEALRRDVRTRLATFVGHCASVYGYTHEPEDSLLEVTAQVKHSFTPGSMVGGVGGAAVGAYGGATLGGAYLGAVGALVGLFIGGPLGALAGFKIGVSTGATVGAGAGAVGGGIAGLAGDREAKVTVRVDEAVLRSYTTVAVAWAAALAYQGFGQGEVVSERSMAQLHGAAFTAVGCAPALQLSSATQDAVSEWMQAILRNLGV